VNADRDVAVPTAIEAERYVLGALMYEPTALAKIDGWLGEDDFFRADHRVIFRALVELIGKDHPVDPVTMGEYFDANSLAEKIGGLDYVLDLYQNCFTAASIVAHAEIMSEKARLRRLSDIGARLMSSAVAPGGSSGDLAAGAAHELSQMQVSRLRGGLGPIKPALVKWWGLLQSRFESGQQVTGLPTPWADINALTYGLQPGNLIVLGGRPAMGKTICAGQLAMFTALCGARAGVFSLEMTSDELVQRCVSAMASIPHDWLRSPAAHQAQDYWSEVSTAVASLVNAPLWIDDQPSLTVEQICARARRAHMQSPLALVVVDHLHIVKIRGGDNTVRELGDVSRALKALAKELSLPVVVLAQLNRATATRADRRPTMADLRASGEIEQDADFVLLLHREDYYRPATDEPDGAVEVIVGKGRNAPASTIYLRNRFDVMRVDDWTGPPPVPRKAQRAPRSGMSGGFD
jgi:replicative DNA helicase